MGDESDKWLEFVTQVREFSYEGYDEYLDSLEEEQRDYAEEQFNLQAMLSE